MAEDVAFVSSGSDVGFADSSEDVEFEGVEAGGAPPFEGGDNSFPAASTSIVWTLGITSTDAVPLLVDFTYKRRKRQIRSEHRALGGSLRIYKWGEYERFRVRVDHMAGAQLYKVNSWFDNNSELLLFISCGGVTEVNSVKIMDNESPIAQTSRPYHDLFKGVINLEGY